MCGDFSFRTLWRTWWIFSCFKNFTKKSKIILFFSEKEIYKLAFGIFFEENILVVRFTFFCILDLFFWSSFQRYYHLGSCVRFASVAFFESLNTKNGGKEGKWSKINKLNLFSFVSLICVVCLYSKNKVNVGEWGKYSA